MDKAKVHEREPEIIFIFLVLFVSIVRWLFYLLCQPESSIIISFGEFPYEHLTCIMFFVNTSKVYYFVKHFTLYFKPEKHISFIYLSFRFCYIYSMMLCCILIFNFRFP
ncbi:hypothetical protein Hanom_Chr03g00227571 [Helianthus anomalus]